jgi:hypothetical protein
MSLNCLKMPRVDLEGMRVVSVRSADSAQSSEQREVNQLSDSSHGITLRELRLRKWLS